MYKIYSLMFMRCNRVNPQMTILNCQFHQKEPKCQAVYLLQCPVPYLGGIMKPS